MPLCSHLLPCANLPLRPDALRLLDKDECAYCFATQKSPAGLDVCLGCLVTCCHTTHAPQHACASNTARLNLRLVERPVVLPPKEESGPAPLPTKLEIVPPKSDAEIYAELISLYCRECSTLTPFDALLPNEREAFRPRVDAIKSATPAVVRDEIKAWELVLESCAHVRALPKVSELSAATLADGEGCHAPGCGLTENLWICLVCGYRGCGRAQPTMKGHGHAKAHAEKHSKTHAVVAKLGTFGRCETTKKPTGDVYCYACDDERVDDALDTHLALVGIDLDAATRTEKTLIELQIAQNLQTYDFNMLGADGAALVPRPGATGLSNLGNTCYLAATLQALTRAVPAFLPSTIPRNCSCAQPLKCLDCVWNKLGAALRAGADPAVTPSQFWRLVCGSHEELRTRRQQDAAEFLAHFLRLVALQAAKSTVAEDDYCRAGPRMLEHALASRTVCSACGAASTSSRNGAAAHVFTLSLPNEALIANSEVTFQKCFEDMLYNDSVEGYRCPACSVRCTAQRATGFAKFPDVLAVVCPRVVYANSAHQKSSIKMQFLDNNARVVDLRAMKVETDDAIADVGTSSSTTETSPHLETLVGLGIEKSVAAHALRLCADDVERAMNWVFDNPNFQVPAPTQANTSSKQNTCTVDENALASLAMMGFDKDVARRALTRTNNSPDRAIELILSDPTLLCDQESTETAPAMTIAGHDQGAKYRLVSFINHNGPSLHCGHYVAHALDSNENDINTWVMFNDDRVVLQPDIQPLCESAYIYFFQRMAE